MSKDRNIDVIVEVEKYNHNHDELGRFSSGSAGIPMGRSSNPSSAGEKAPDKVALKIAHDNFPSMSERKDLDTHNSDSEDFFEASVWGVRSAIQDAYKAGGGKRITDKDALRIAQNHFSSIEGRKDLATHDRDAEDFFDVSVWGVKGAINEAYRLGHKKTSRTAKSASITEIEEVKKFNPFHDSAGRFSSSNGFATYSANPNTRAGAMAIARSAAAGHGNTVNVHRDSYGENIRQNANWLGRGKQQSPHQQGNATLRNRVEPVAGLPGASATGASWQYQNQQQGRSTKPGKQPAQQQQQKPAQTTQQQTSTQNAQQQANQAQANQKPSQSLSAKVAGVTLTAGDKMAIDARDRHGQRSSTKKVVDDHDQDIVKGKDISKNVDVRNVPGGKDPIDKIAELQGWNKAPTVTNDMETFQKAAKQSGQMLIRTVAPNSSTRQSSDDICKATMGDGNASLGGNGGKVYGSGMYMVGATFGNSTGINLGRKVARSQSHSFAYGDTQMNATVHPNAKIAGPRTASRLRSEFRRLSYSDQQRYGDHGAYIASKGYDGAQWHSGRSDPYITMYNKSALIFFGGVST